MADPISVLLVDDQALLRQALASLLEQNSDIKIVSNASDGHEAIRQVALHRPDIALIDVEMPALDGLSATQLITQRFPETKVIVLSAHDQNTYLVNALKAGAKSYLLKDTLSEELINTIRMVHKGYGQFGPGILEKMVAGITTTEEASSEVVAEQDALAASTPTSASAHGIENSAPSSALVLGSPQSKLSKSSVTKLLNRFEPDELLTFVQQLQGHTKTTIALKPILTQRLAKEPTNLAALYLQGVLASQAWQQPKKAYASLQAGFQAGIQQEVSPHALWLFYKAARSLNPTLAFSWLTHVDSPWNSRKGLPFLIREAAKLFGKGSPQYRSLLLTYRIRTLKAMILTRQKHHAGQPPIVTPGHNSVVLSAI